MQYHPNLNCPLHNRANANAKARLALTHLLLTKEKRTVRVVSLLLNLIKMPLKHKENVLTTIEDIQRLASKDLKNILRENAVAQGGKKPDLVMKMCDMQYHPNIN